MKIVLRKCILFVTLCSFFLGTCASHVYGLSIGEEKELGEQLLYQIRQAFSLLDDPDIDQYINMLGDEVLEVAGVQYFDYHFSIIQSSQFNAFAAPSGLIFFYTGLIEKMETEDELVSVLAHEIGHVVSRHIAKGIDKNTKVTVATSVLALASIALGAGELSQALLAGSLAAGQTASLHFSREAEEEADLLAYGWMKKMGRFPQGQVDMLRVMRRISRYSLGDNVPQYLMTHPDPASRLDYVQSLIDYEEQQPEDFKKTDNFSFSRMRYRMLSLVKDGKVLRNMYNGKLTNQSLSPESRIMVLYGLSQLDRLENNLESSRKRLQQVIDFFPDRPILLVDMGLVEMEDGNLEKALNLIRQGHDKNRNDHWAIFQLARVYHQLGDLQKAEHYFQELKNATPFYSQLYFELGKVKTEQGENAVSSYYLGKYYLYEGKLKLARESLAKALHDKTLPVDKKKDVEETMALIDRLEKEA